MFFLIINKLDALMSQIYSWNETLYVSDSFPVHHQESFTVHTAMVYVSKPVWHIPLLCVQWKAPDDGQRNCLKHIEFHFKNKFEKLVHLVGFIIRNLSRCTVTWTSNKYVLLRSRSGCVTKFMYMTVGIVTRLWAWRCWFRYASGVARSFSVSKMSTPTVTAACTLRTGDSFGEGKWPGHGADHSSASGAEVKDT